MILMGDFNEVRYKSDRFGSVFNAKGALAFNSFIEDAELEEVNLGGSMFTWCHKSDTKMSKLDRFFVSNNLLNSCPHISAFTLERYLTDHRLILLRETECDYGPTPFRFFHHWLELDGFNNFVVDSWGLAPGDGKNAMRNLVYKLKFLKEKIRVWVREYRRKCFGEKDHCRDEIKIIDEIMDKGKGSEFIVNKRMELVNAIHRLDHLQAMKLAQKVKVKWAIEGDENSSFFHGMLNKNRHQTNI